MPDEEKGSSVQTSEEAPDLRNSEEEAAAAKLWAVYVSEAEKYDKALVESWKSDMEGMLIFAGLFSASLTAFIIESYKTLTPNSGDSTVQLLTQISQQLAAAANGTTFTPPPSTVFRAPSTSLVCNALWFISLGLSLTCALIATLLEQWARDFLHRADMCSAPVIRARIFSYLYYGLKRFNMHMVVEIIPLLLHASLVFFFAGLVAFLIPINIAMTGVATALLTIVAAVYSFLTLIPLRYLDCPYRTPLSGAFWRLLRHWQTPLSNSDSSSMETMVEAMSRRATEPSAGRTSRDFQALAWTVKSLADDTELEPFVEGIPDVLWGPSKRRYVHDDHIQRLMGDPDLQLLPRIEGLLRSCDSGLLSPEAFTRRQVTCCKALWAIASLRDPSSSHRQAFPLPTSFDRPDIRHYSISAFALMEGSVFCVMEGRLAELSNYLALCEAEYEKEGDPPNLQPIRHYLKSVLPTLNYWFPIDFEILDYIMGIVANPPVPLERVIAGLSRVLSDVPTIPYRILFNYLQESATLESPPYRWHETRRMMALDKEVQFPTLKPRLEGALHSVVYSDWDRLNDAKTDGWIDNIIRELYDFWISATGEPTPLPRAIIHYLNNRSSDDAVRQFMSPAGKTWPAFPITLSPASEGIDPGVPIDEVLTALWRISPFHDWWPSNRDLRIDEAVLEAVMNIGSCSSSTLSVIPMVKTKILGTLNGMTWSRTFEDWPLNHWLLCPETALVIPPEFLEGQVGQFTGNPSSSLHFHLLQSRVVETRIALIAEFLDNCNSGLVHYKAAETIRHIGATMPRAQIHASHQTRLATGMNRAANVDEPDIELLDAVISCKIFDVYAGIPDSPRRLLQELAPERYAWLENPTARVQIKNALSGYVKSNPIASPISVRAQAVIGGLDRLHAGAEEIGPI